MGFLHPHISGMHFKGSNGLPWIFDILMTTEMILAQLFHFIKVRVDINRHFCDKGNIVFSYRISALPFCIKYRKKPEVTRADD